MLKLLFNRKQSAVENHYKISPGIFIEDPALKHATIEEQALAINETMAVVAPYLAQFYYDDNQLTKRPCLSGISAITLRPDAYGNIYLTGVSSRERELTAKLRLDLPQAVSDLIKPITTKIKGDSKYSNTNLLKVINLRTGLNSVVGMSSEDEVYITERTSNILCSDPRLAFIEMVKTGNYTDECLMTCLHLMSCDINELDINETLKMLSEVDRTEVKNSFNLFNSVLTSLHKTYFSDTDSLDTAKSMITNMLVNNWRDWQNEFEIYWGEHKIGDMRKLSSSLSVDVLRNGTAWAVKTKPNINGFNVPQIYDAVEPYFPTAIMNLLPERVDPEQGRLPAAIYHEALLKTKPFALGGLYFHDTSLPHLRNNTLSRLTTQLNHVSQNLIFSPDITEIDLNQNPDAFERFSHEIANKACLLSIPGFQLKAPASLSTIDGKSKLTFAEPKDFTHIIKFPSNKSDKKGLVYAELFGMMLSRSAGVNTADFRAIPTNIENVTSIFPKNVTGSQSLIDDIVSSGEPAYITELFDRPVGDDQIMYMNEDFLSSSKRMDKYKELIDLSNSKERLSLFSSVASKIENVSNGQFHGIDILAKTLRARSTNYAEDIKALYKQLIANTLVGNGDAHLKNFSVLHISKPNGLSEIRLSPAYDILSTRALCPNHFYTKGVCMLGGSYTPSRNDMINDAVLYLGLSREQAITILDETLVDAMKFAYSTAETPLVSSVFNETALGKEVFNRAINYVKLQTRALAASTPNPDMGVDDKVLFESMYPNMKYNNTKNVDVPALSEVIEVKMPNMFGFDDLAGNTDNAASLKL